MVRLVLSFLLFALPLSAMGADIVPTDIQQPGTQPGEVGTLESPGRCDNCHGGYDQAVEMAHNWRGSMMAQAGRDPIFWATVAIAEQDLTAPAIFASGATARPGGWKDGLPLQMVPGLPRATRTALTVISAID